MKYRKYIALLCAASLALTGCSVTKIVDTTEETEEIEEEDNEADETVNSETEKSSEESGEYDDDLSNEGESKDGEEDDSTDDSELVTPVDMIDTEDQFTERDLDGSYDDTVEEVDLSDLDGSYEIEEEGTYVFSGELNGQIIVNCDDDSAKVQIVLSDTIISNDDGPCILAYGADKVFITLEGENTLSDSGEEYAQSGLSDKNEDGVIFTDCDVCFNGSGALTINASYANAIVSKADLKITNGIYIITAEKKGIEANDSIRIAGGVILVTSGDDAIHTDEDEESGKGYIYIQDGSLDLSSGDDGIHAATALLITSGSINITESYEGLEADSIDIQGGDIQIVSSDDGINASTGSGSGGFDPMDQEFDLDSIEDMIAEMDDDELNQMMEMMELDEDEFAEWLEDPDMSDLSKVFRDSSQTFDNEMDMNGEDKNESSGENFAQEIENEPNGEMNNMEIPDTDDMTENPGDTMDSDNQPASEDMNGQEDTGIRTIPAPDDLDSNMAVNEDGTNFSPDENSSNDTQNSDIPADGSESKHGGSRGDMGGDMGGGMGFSAQPAYIRISGGTIYINAQGDGIDSNGDLYIDGGYVYVDGPTNGGNGAIDYGDGDAEGIVTGGTVVAVGSSQMAENFSDSSTQYAVMVNFDQTAEAGTEIILMDGEGNEVLSYTPAKTFNSVLISTPELQEGTYTLTVGDQSEEFTIESIITQVGNGGFGSGGGAGGSGGNPGGGINPGGNMEKPDDNVSEELQ